MDNLLDRIEALSYEELITLNRAIVARVKEFNAQKAKAQLDKFRIGNQVHFMTDEEDQITGTIVRINKKTVSLVTAEGERWKVSPSLLTIIKDASPMPADQSVIELFD